MVELLIPNQTVAGSIPVRVIPFFFILRSYKLVLWGCIME